MSKIRMRSARQGKATAIIAALTTVAIAASAPAYAATLYSTGFEAPGYATGQLTGQAGWYGATNASVQTTTVDSGLQAASVDTGATGQHITSHAISYDSATSLDKIVTISTDFRLNALTPDVTWEALTASGNGGFITQLLVNGGGRVCGFNPCDGPYLAVDTWNTLSMQLDYTTGMVKDFVNGVEFSSGSFSNIPGHSTTLNYIGIGTNNTWVAGSGATASWDNLSVISSAVPEPATWSMMLVGFAMLGLARRRKAAIPA